MKKGFNEIQIPFCGYNVLIATRVEQHGLALPCNYLLHL